MYEEEDRQTEADSLPNDGVDRRSVLESAAAIGATGGLLGGATGVASAHEKPHELVIKALTGKTRVLIEVSGEIARGEHAGDTDTIENGNVAISRINNRKEADSFRFSGDIVRFEIREGDVRVTLNGRQVDPATLGRAPSSLPNEVIMDALSDGVEVRIVVSGKIMKGNLSGESDAIEDGNVAISRIPTEEEVDNFHYSGHIVQISVLKGNVTMQFNRRDP